MSTVFQGLVGATLASGVLGELAYAGPTRGQPIVFAADSENNCIARAVTIVEAATATFSQDGDTSDPRPLTVQAGGTGAFAGIVVSPKNQVVYGFENLKPMVLPKGTVADALTMGEIWCACSADAAPGNAVGFLQATGELVPVADASAPGAGVTVIPNATVKYYASAADNLFIVSLL